MVDVFGGDTKAVRKFTFREETLKRCKVAEWDEKTAKRFSPVAVELFHYLLECSSIDFSLFFKYEDKILEFIRPKEFSHDYVEQMLGAITRAGGSAELCVLKTEHARFTHLIDTVRNKKIKALLEKDPSLDANVLNVYATLSSASQLVLRGGITAQVVNFATSAAAELMSSQIDCEVAVGTLSRMIACDSTLYDHSASVALFSSIIAAGYLKTKLGSKECTLVAECGLFHDAGKSCIPNNILNKPGKFNDHEYEIMKSHALRGWEELSMAIENGAAINPCAALVARQHHERFKGGGYPDGKWGRAEEDAENGIHLYARIVSIADVYSALLMDRVYKEAMDSNGAIEFMRRMADDAFDPRIFEPFYTQVKNSITLFTEREKNPPRQGMIKIIGDDESFASALKEVSKARRAKS